MVRVPCPLTLRKVQHLAVRQNVPCLFKVLGHAEPLFCQLPAVLCSPAVFFCFRIIGQLPFVHLCIRPCLQPFSRFPHPVAQRRALFFQLCQTAVVVLALCNVTLVFLALAVRLCLCRKIPQRFLLCFNGFYFCAFQPCRALFLQRFLLFAQRFLLFAQRLLLGAQLFHLVRFRDLHPHIFLYRCVILCYSSIRRYFLSTRMGAPHIHREMCGSIFFFCQFSGVIKLHVAAICPAHFMRVKGLTSIFPDIGVDNYCRIDSRPVNNDWRSENKCVISTPLPVVFISDLFSAFDDFRNSCHCRLLRCTVSMSNGLICSIVR